MVTIDGRSVGEGSPCYIIAEAGENHLGNLGMAMRLIDEAADAGADAVKFQTTKLDELYDPGYENYEKNLTMLFDRGQHRALMDRAAEKGVTFISTPFDERSADLLDDLGVPAFKIGSGELTHLSMLKHVAANLQEYNRGC